MLQDTPTLFVVQHLGKSMLAVLTPASTPASIAITKPVPAPQPAPPVVDSARSSIAWQKDNLGTKLTATVHVTGAVSEASVEVRGYEIPLTPKPEEPAVLTGSTTIAIAPVALFRVVTPATLTVTKNAETPPVIAPIAWDAPLRPRMTLAERYTTARALLPQTLGPIIHTSRAISISAFTVFALAWLINLFIEIRRQHIDLIVPGGALVLLLGFLSFV